MSEAASPSDLPPASGVILVTGPARSGKSEWAEALATDSRQPVIYLATARRDPSDRDWEARLAAHAARRPAAWQTQEVPVELPAAIAAWGNDTMPVCLLIDSLGAWTANWLDREEARWQNAVTALLQALQPQQPGALMILVAEETGWGVVPAYLDGRKFRDRLGALTRRVAARADRTYLVAGGHALDLSQLGIPLPPKS